MAAPLTAASGGRRLAVLPPGRWREGGFALVTVLWAAMILALIVASVLATSRTETRLAHNRQRIAELDAIGGAALNIAILKLLDPAPSAQPPVAGTPFDVTFAGHTIRVSVQDETGKIDLNMAQPPLLRHLLMAAGLDPSAAQALTDKILDWREHGIGKRLNGAKAEDYRLAGYAYGPRNGPFESVAELQLVMGMTPSLFRRIAPALTVYSQSAWIDPRFAPADVLRALSGWGVSGVSDALAKRRARKAAGNAAAVVMAGHAFTIAAMVGAAGGINVRRSAVIRLTGSRNPAYWVYRWD